MKNFFLAFLLFLVSLTASATNFTSSGFRSIPWGTSKTEVLAKFPTAEHQKDGTVIVREQGSGRRTLLIFVFSEQKLLKVVELTKFATAIPEEVASACNREANEFVKDNGLPTNKFVDQELGLVLEWTNPTTTVQMGCVIEDSMFAKLSQKR